MASLSDSSSPSAGKTVTQQKCLLLRSTSTGPLTHVKAADAIAVKGMCSESRIEVWEEGQRRLVIKEDGTYPLRVRDKKIQIARLSGESPITVFAEMTYAVNPTK